MASDERSEMHFGLLLLTAYHDGLFRYGSIESFGSVDCVLGPGVTKPVVVEGSGFFVVGAALDDQFGSGIRPEEGP